MRDIIGAKRRERSASLLKEISKFRVFSSGAVVQSVKRTSNAASYKRPFGAGLADNADDL